MTDPTSAASAAADPAAALITERLSRIAARDDVDLAPSAVPTVAAALLPLVPVLTASEPLTWQRVRMAVLAAAGFLIERGFSTGNMWLVAIGVGGLAGAVAWREVSVRLRRRIPSAGIPGGEG